MGRDIKTSLAALCELLSRITLDTQDEKHAQRQLEFIFIKLKISFIREYKLGDGYIDFFFPNTGIGLEMKAHHSTSKSDVYRQCERYTSHDSIKGLILATGKFQGLPNLINGKPTMVHLISEGTL
ncbi:hypothetical protein [Vibrio owensii]|uniref:hypothetical protein n=1 Tax=Vibrio owensii TaxID=696485 RepID=UPI0018F1C6F6|nr:hypothetical protein [Vibrio owensii]